MKQPRALDVDPRASEHPDEPVRMESVSDADTSAANATVTRRFRALTDRSAPRDTSQTPVFFGLLHAHTLISDGSGTPEDAFAAARNAGLDFIGVTPHNHDAAESGASTDRKDGILIRTNPDLYNAGQSVHVTRFAGDPQREDEVTLKSLKAAAAAATDDTFVALMGQEFSTISSGNHANVFQPADVIDTIENGNYKAFYESFSSGSNVAATVVQWNHPDVHRDMFYSGSDSSTIGKMFNDYGYDDYDENFRLLAEGAEPVVALIEVLSGPALDEHVHPVFHYSSHRLHEDDYYFYLVQGFHLSPSAGQDNHYPTWGRATPARMGVFAAELTPASLISAMRENRTYATEDSDLELRFHCNDAPMGSTLTLDTNADIACRLSVEDPSQPNETYEANLYYADIAPSEAPADLQKWLPSDGMVESVAFGGDGEMFFDVYLASGAPELFYVRVTQGDGDRAWSAPIWINHPRPRSQ